MLDHLKLMLFFVLNTIKNWGLGLWAETKKLGVNVYGRLKGIVLSVYAAVVHFVMIAVHGLQWLWGIAVNTWNAVSGKLALVSNAATAVAVVVASTEEKKNN